MCRLLFGSALFVSAFALTSCFGMLKEAQDNSLKLATALHKQMAVGDLAGIYNNADENYRRSMTRERSDALFSTIARKLGAPLDCKAGGINVDVNTLGTTLRSHCETHFSNNATGDESFVWLKSGDHYRLVSYHISSQDLIER
jgi:hypothetical protein